jgi:hypothetical protein
MPPPELGIIAITPFVGGFGVGDGEHVMGVDKDAAGTAELGPRRDEFAILVENLHPVVAPVGPAVPRKGHFCAIAREKKGEAWRVA